jgi:hypothetical protein
VVILAQGPCKSWLDGTDLKRVAFSTKVQQARHKDREAKTEKQKGGEWEQYYQRQGPLPKRVYSMK